MLSAVASTVLFEGGLMGGRTPGHAQGQRKPPAVRGAGRKKGNRNLPRVRRKQRRFAGGNRLERHRGRRGKAPAYAA